MKRIFILGILLIVTFSVNSQKLQRIGFVDMAYVLENIPSYQVGQNQLNEKVTLWKNNLKKLYVEVEDLKKELENEKVLLTDDLIKERKANIAEKELEIQKIENSYFGVKGKLFQLRQKMVEPFQDMVFNAVQEIAKKRRYDMIFEKSSAITLLYANKSYDVSKLVINYITKTKKQIENEEKARKREEARAARLKRVEEQKKRREEERKKREEARLKRIK